MRFLLIGGVLAGSAACGDGGGTPADAGGDAEADADAGDVAAGEAGDVGLVYTEEREPCAHRNPRRNLYFGDLHAHTLLSFDAWAYGLRVTPDEAYGFARGEPIRLPPLDGEGLGTREARIDRPLDFVALSDHLDLIGEVRLCLTPGSSAYESETCAVFRAGGEMGTARLGVLTGNPRPSRDPTVCGEDGEVCRSAAAEVWVEIGEAAERAYDRTSACRFTSLLAYEYTASPTVTNLHRNVVFRTAAVPARPPTYFEASTPERLWATLRDDCLEAGIGCDVIVIPHNLNWSNGSLFVPAWRDEPDVEVRREAAGLRARLEPLVEIFQHKGAMECRNGFAGVDAPVDPLCPFEDIRPFDLPDCGEGTGTGGVLNRGCVSRLDYVRNVFREGMRLRLDLGFDPYRLGVVGSTDTHNGSPGHVSELDFPGHVGVVDDTIARRLGEGTGTHQASVYNPGGLAAVWSEELSRDALFEAFRRRETYATSGPRIGIRFFGGWETPADLCGTADPVAEADRAGVPMGGELRPVAGGVAPRFWVRADADPGTATVPGTLLQRVQIVKGWLDGSGVSHERVYEVAGDPESGASVDPATCVSSGDGFDSLCVAWTDPDFDPSVPAFWYVRVLENPTCRWSARQCLELDPADRPSVCSDSSLPSVIQERAWTTPIWYVP